LPQVDDNHTVLVLYGDVPLVQDKTLKTLVGQVSDTAMALLTARLDNPHGYGRIVRDAQGNACGIVEEKDASDEQRRINEINTGFMAAGASQLKRWCSSLDNNNAQGEYYLTDVIAMAANEGVRVATSEAHHDYEIAGVNSRSQLAGLERTFQKLQAERLMKAGVTIMDPARFDQRGHLSIGQDSVVDINGVFEGEVQIGEEAVIGPNCVITNTTIGNGVHVLANSVIDNAVIGDGCRIGPFARIRPETRLGDNVHVGNFVEIKKSTVADNSKINHLSYVGDSTVGQDVNIGAGTITCNYDGACKHHTTIGDRVFVGSDTQLVAPVVIGDDATIGAGTTVTKDVPAGELVTSRVPQKTRSGWKRPQKKR
jgi:bifunctional UDP-N-acetylglucosamine pyrophosphorylase/glucosamine-1-phosphate N-acetyltransferase